MRSLLPPESEPHVVQYMAKQFLRRLLILAAVGVVTAMALYALATVASYF